MKIHNDGPGALTNATDPLAGMTPDKAGPSKARDLAAGVSSGAEALTLSPEARLLQAAAEQSVGGPAIRQDVVDRMRALLDAGKVGHDAAALADAMIDDWLTQP